MTTVAAEEPVPPNRQEEAQRIINEMNEVIAFLDYSFERAYTVKEREYIIAYMVSSPTKNKTCSRHTLKRSRKTSKDSGSNQKISRL